MNEIQLRDQLFKLFPPESNGDWEDVLRRAQSPRWHVRRLTFLVAVVFLAVLALGSALALSGRLGGLFHGTPVNDLTPRERFLLSEFDMNGKVELIVRRGSSAFYVIRRKDGRLCYSIGEIRKHLTPAQVEGQMRFGGGGCIDPRVFPSRAEPVLNYSYYSYRPGDPAAKLVGLQGFAADPVARIGVIGSDNRNVFSVPVEENVYSAGRKGIAGARGIVALDKDGKPIWVQCHAGPSPAPHFPSGGCGQYKNTPPPNLPSTALPTRPSRPQGPLVVQRGTANGASITVRRDELEVRLDGISSATRRLLQGRRGRINVGCFKLVKVGDKRYSSAGSVTKDLAPVVQAQISPLGGLTAPFDGCTVTGMYGHTWNDSHGTHDAVEIPLTPLGRRYFAERAPACDISWLARARVFHDVRYARESLVTEEVARRLGSHVVALPTPATTPPLGKLGLWLGNDRRIVLVERTTTGRRLYLDPRRGLIYRTNLIGLA